MDLLLFYLPDQHLLYASQLFLHIQGTGCNSTESNKGYLCKVWLHQNSTKRAILYGPTVLGNRNFKDHFNTIQGKILTFLKTWRSFSQASQLLRIAVAWAQYAVGTGVYSSWMSPRTSREMAQIPLRLPTNN
jgi:hypothetical protein